MISITDIGNVAQGVIALTSAVALIYGGRQLAQTKTLAREGLVTSYLQRVNDADFYGSLSRSRDYLNVPESYRAARWADWVRLSVEEKQVFVLPMNLFEELGTLYNDGLLDRHATRRLLGDASLDYWREVSWFVKRYQEIDADALHEWEVMNDDLRQPERSLGAVGTPWQRADIFAGTSGQRRPSRC